MVKTLFLDAPYTGEVELCDETLNYLKKFNKVGLYASVQFVSKLERIEKQLEDIGVKWVSSHADRAHVVKQLLGCDNYHDSLNLKEEVDAYLYIGDGKFHPLALVYGQKESEEFKEVVCNDPIQKKMFMLGLEEIAGILGKYRASLIKFLSSDKVGVIITIKPGQEQYKPSLELEKKYDKKFFYFIDNNVSFDQIENFPFIDVWVNTACPRVGFDDQEKFLKGVINLNDALKAEEVLSTMSTVKRKV